MVPLTNKRISTAVRLIDGTCNRKKIKKILKNCPKVKLAIEDRHDLKLSRYLWASNHLSIEMAREFKLTEIGEILRNLLNLQTIKVKTFGYQLENNHSMGETSENRLFAPLHKLSRLKRVKFIADNEDFQKAKLERDLEEFYGKPRNFHLCIRINITGEFIIEENSNLARILKAAEYLCICDSKFYHNDESLTLEKEEKRRMKFGKKNIVKISNYVKYYEKKDIDVPKALSYCDSLEHLYIRETRHLIKWKSSPADQEEEIKGFRNLKFIALEFQHLFVDDKSAQVVEESADAEWFSRFSSSLFAIFSRIKQNCHSLKNLSLYLSENFGWIGHRYSHDMPLFRKNYSQFIQGVSTFDKLRKLGLVMPSDSLSLFPLSQILSNNNIESFQLKLNPGIGNSMPKWDSYFSTENKSQIKELKIISPKERNIYLFGANLLKDVRMLGDLQVIELIDRNLEEITFDFFYEFLTCLLEKKNMRKILICTKIYSENMPSDISQEFEDKLKDLQVEEIFIGKLKGGSFDYLLYNKEMGIVNKLFWSQKEIDEKKKELKRRYGKVFDLFKKHDNRD